MKMPAIGVYWLAAILLPACQGPGPLPGPTPTPAPTATATSAAGRTAAGLAGCWVDGANPQRRQYYTATGPDTLDLRLVVSGRLFCAISLTSVRGTCQPTSGTGST